MVNALPHYSHNHEPVSTRQSPKVYLEVQTDNDIHMLIALPHYSHDCEPLLMTKSLCIPGIS